MTKVILFIATSQDGFIADLDGGIDWLPQPSEEIGDFGYQNLIDDISMIFMGHKSYRQILTFGDWAWPEKKTYVFTSQNLKKTSYDVTFVNQSIKSFMNKIRSEKSNENIWLLGGAELAKSFSDCSEIDEYIITIIPVNLGEGIKLDIDYSQFIQTDEISLKGIVQKTYIKKQTQAT